MFFILPLKKTCFKKSSSLNLYDNNADQKFGLSTSQKMRVPPLSGPPNISTALA